MLVPGDWHLTEEWGLLLAPSSPETRSMDKYVGKACCLGKVSHVFGDGESPVQNGKSKNGDQELGNKWERQGQLY